MAFVRSVAVPDAANADGRTWQRTSSLEPEVCVGSPPHNCARFLPLFHDTVSTMTYSRIALVMTGFALLSGFPVRAASADVSTLDDFKAQVCRGEMVTAACRNQVEDLDRKLNAAFREASRVASNKVKLRSQQRRWLTETRDRTSDLSEAKAAHLTRILELQEIAIRAIGRRELPMEEVEQQEICKGIAGLASRGELAALLLQAREMPDAVLTAAEEAKAAELLSYQGSDSRYFALPIRRDQQFPYADVFTGGTCYSAEIFRAASPLEDPVRAWPSEEIEANEADDVIRWATWGGGESILMFGGRYFFVTGRSSGPGIVTWVTPIGTRRPICSLDVELVERSVNFVRDDASLCAAAARDELPPISWATRPYDPSKWTETEGALMRARGLRGAGLPGVELAIADIDNDNVRDTLGRAQYDSGAGCGGSLSRLMLLTDDGEHLKTGATNDALMDLATYNAKPVEVVSYRSRTYVRAQLQETPALFHVTPEAVQTECLFHDQPISRVRTLYPLDGAVRDPTRERRP